MPALEDLATARLALTALRVEDADEMVEVLADERLYAHTGGTAPDRAALRERYARQTAGISPDGAELWFNWIVRDAGSRTALGYVQATLDRTSGTADVAWVIGAGHQQHGYATEAAGALVRWLADREDVRRVTAHISRTNRASQAVARRLGFAETGDIQAGEPVWEIRAP